MNTLPVDVKQWTPEDWRTFDAQQEAELFALEQKIDQTLFHLARQYRAEGRPGLWLAYQEMQKSCRSVPTPHKVSVLSPWAVSSDKSSTS